MKTEQIIERLFALIDKLIDRAPGIDATVLSRLAAVEHKLAEMEKVWPQIQENK